MSRRNQLLERIQALSREEGLRQPTAAEWLAMQDNSKVQSDPELKSAEKEKKKSPDAQDDSAETERPG